MLMYYVERMIDLNEFYNKVLRETNNTNKEIDEKLVEIVKELSNYDIYDFIKRISSLNLFKVNQNKAIIFDFIIAAVLMQEESFYSGKNIMSDSKFKQLVLKVSRSSISFFIDPPDNLFTQNVMFRENFKVFNGIGHTPAYNLQFFIDSIYYYENNYPEEFIKKSMSIIILVLKLSTSLWRKTEIESMRETMNNESTFFPDSKHIKEYSGMIEFDSNYILKLLNYDLELMKSILTDFAQSTIGNTVSRPFYKQPFLSNLQKDSIILLNVGLLPEFACEYVMNLADEYGIAEKVLNRFNDLVWFDTKKSLRVMSHYKIQEDQFDIKLLNLNYYKETILNVYNDALMFVVFLSEDYELWKCSNDCNSQSFNYSEILNERLSYITDKLKLNKNVGKIPKLYFIIICNGIKNVFDLAIIHNTNYYPPLVFNSFEFKCLSINEKDHLYFIPFYIKAKNKLSIINNGFGNELSIISAYTENDYSFYFSDDYSITDLNIYFPYGESVNYIRKAIKKVRLQMVPSYYKDWDTKIIAKDIYRSIYIEPFPLDKDRISYCLLIDNRYFWFISNETLTKDNVNLYMSILDSMTYWFSQAKEIIEQMNVRFNVVHFNVALEGDLSEYGQASTTELLLTELINFEVVENNIFLFWSAESYNIMINQSSEKQLLDLMLQGLEMISQNKIKYSLELDSLFTNRFKKKFFSIDVSKNPYLLPVNSDHRIGLREENDDVLLDLIGSNIIGLDNSGESTISKEERRKVSNGVVSFLYKLLQEEVSQISSQNLIEVVYLDLEKTLYDLMMIRDRFVFDVSCYPEREKAVIKKYNDLNRLSVSLKFLMEYLSAILPKGDNQLSLEKYEYILSICSLIIHWAYNNDLFYYDIFKTPINFLKSKRLGINRKEYTRLFEMGIGFQKDELNRISSDTIPKLNVIDKDPFYDLLNEAYLSSFNYSFDDFSNVVHIIVGIGYEEENDIKTLDIVSLVEKIRNQNSEISISTVNKIIEDICLTERENFMVLPKGFRKEDVYPWRFNRNYSFIRRPLIKRNDEVIWGNRQLLHMYSYTVDLIFTGRFRTKDCKMASLVGQISNELGNKFNKLVGDVIMELKEFAVYSNIKKFNSKYITDKNGNTLGDIDLVIVDSKYRTIYITEVKNFSYSRNPYEIQQEYKKMFQDKPTRLSFLTKHNNRIKWIMDNLDDLLIELNLAEDDWNVKGLFIVSEDLVSAKVYNKNINIITASNLTVKAIRDL